MPVRWQQTPCLYLLIPKLVLALAAAALAHAPVRAETLVFHASASGKETLDQGEGGGNPFASALIDILARPPLKLSDLPPRLRQLTAEKSKGFQSADVPTSIAQERFLLVPPRKGERRIALLMVVADYKASGEASLPGAKHDAERVALALQKAGFATELALDLGLEAMRAKVETFGFRSMDQDAAVIYVTGHGVEVDGKIFLLPGDYPVGERNNALVKRALPLADIVQSLRAKQINLIFYGGCRHNPYGQ